MDFRKIFEERQRKELDGADLSLKDINKIFKTAEKDIEKAMKGFYAEYGKLEQVPKVKTVGGVEIMKGTKQSLKVPEGIIKTGKYTQLQKQIAETLKTASTAERATMSAALKKTAVSTYYGTMYEVHKGVGVGTSFDLLTSEVVEQLVLHPVNGKNFSERVAANTQKMYENVDEIMKTGIYQGVDTATMAKRLDKISDSGEVVANRLLRTEITNTLNQATKETYKNSGVVEKYQYMASLDNRTSEVCEELDGEIFKLEEATTGLNFPPMHPNCRSTTVPYFDKNYAQERISRLPSGEVKYVPADTNYKEWAKEFNVPQ